MTNAIKGRVAKFLVSLADANTFPLAQTFTTGIKLGATPVTLSATNEPTTKLLELDTGIYSHYSSAVNAILYGFASDVTRSGGTGFVVGGQFSAYNSVVGNTSGMFGVVSQAWNQPGAAGNMVGAEFAVINETSSASSAKVGMDVVFKDRSDISATVTSGISSNLYNEGAIALQVSSQARSTAGEYCGWLTGIYFTEDSMDRSTARNAIGIDFASVKYLAPGTPSFSNSYHMTAAIRFRDFQSILWNGDPTTSTVDPANPIRTFFDSTDSVFRLNNGVFERFGIDVATGDIQMYAGAKLCLNVTNNNAILWYDSTDSKAWIANGPSKMFGVSILTGALTFPTTTCVQTTVGAAGGASALPATPSKYLMVAQDGVNYVVPMYLAA